MFSHRLSAQDVLARTDVIFGVGVIGILVVLIMPLPAVLLDMCLGISITFSILVLMTSLLIQKPLEFSSFPLVLLISTMLRLALNVASTRLILAHGHQGSHAAGYVIEAFGHFIMGGSYVIGFIIFSILVIVNFVVITKGSGRIAEVSARFSLDAMPGKQMAIDADLSAGIINEHEAKARRQETEAESSFFGAMDGAAKFVRGDAIAGLFITAVNVVGGIIIGVFQLGVPLTQALQSYTLLTVGDGLVSQIPALIISTAAGMLVSKSSGEGSADKALFSQLGAYPAALGISSFVMVLLATLPGTPKIPFIFLATITGYAAWKMTQSQALALSSTPEEKAKATSTGGADPQPDVSPLQQALHIDQIKLEMGYGLLPLIDKKNDHNLTDQIHTIRQQLAGEIGFIVPSVRIQDNMSLESEKYIIRVKDVEVGRGRVRMNMWLAMNPQGGKIEMPGEPTKEPAFGLDALWISEDKKDQAEKKGCTVVDPVTVIATHLTELAKENMSDLFSYAETQKILDGLDSAHKKLVADMVPGQISNGGIQRVLQNLLVERVSIKDVNTILEGIAEACSFTKDIKRITEHVRMRLSRQICASFLDEDNALPVVTFSPDWENAFHESLVGDHDQTQLAMPPSSLQKFSTRFSEVFHNLAVSGVTPVLLTHSALRPHVYALVERIRPQTPVLSQAEVHPKVRIKTLDHI